MFPVGKLPECKILLPELDSPSECAASTTDAGDETSADVKEENQVIVDHGDMERIKVYLRIRPATSEERSQGIDDSCISVESDHAVVLSAPSTSQAFRNASNQRQRFTFTHVYPPETSQKQFFDGTVCSVASEFVSGQNCLVFTYGVTNSGKTYTIQGNQQQANAGILPRCLDLIFGSVSSRQCTNTTLKPFMFGHVARLTADQVYVCAFRRNMFVFLKCCCSICV